MNCPTEVADILLEILREGTLRIRCYSAANQAQRCFVEADHVHNLPTLISGYRPELLRYYWDVERPAFIRQVPETDRRDFEQLWDRLESLVEHEAPGLPAAVETKA